MAKPICETVRKITMNYLKKHSNLGELSKKGHNERSTIQITQIKQDKNGSKEVFLCNVELITTSCRFGGRRFWFKCPKCQKPTLSLYKHAQNFWCRKCCGLVYASQQRTHTGKYALLEKVIFRDWQEEENKIRTKFHHGKPTRRYQRFLDRMEKNLSPEVLKSLEDLLEQRRKNN